MKHFRLYLGTILTVLSAGTFAQPNDYEPVNDFIKQNWKNVIRYNSRDSATLIGLPYQYTVPTISGMFQSMYYWDTYFTNLGLLLDGQVMQARHNVDNMVWLVNKYGYMPNGNETFYLSRSQPPYLSMMVKDVFESTGDKVWLREVLSALEREYRFWMTQRTTPVGLNRYGSSDDTVAAMEIYSLLPERLGQQFVNSALVREPDQVAVGRRFLAECESGWDFSPRFYNQATQYCPLDLNCNLFMYELNFAGFYEVLGIPGADRWRKLAEARRELIWRYCKDNDENLFYDYDFVNGKRSGILSAANFNALWSGVASPTEAQSIQRNLSRLEFASGIAACEPGERNFNYQWDYPNGWPNLQYLAFAGLDKYGFKEDARRIAGKYCATVADNFEKTGNLWEKYNVADGSINVKNEYEMPSMMGWTAGVFRAADHYLLNGKIE